MAHRRVISVKARLKNIGETILASQRMLSCLLLATTLAPSHLLAESLPLRLITYPLPPLVETLPDGSIGGLSTTLIHEAFQDAGIEYRLSVQPPRRAYVTAVNTKNYCVFPVERSQEREPDLIWLGPVGISRHGFYSKRGRDLPLTTLEDAKPYLIGSQLGSSVGDYLQVHDFNVALVPDSAVAAEMLALGRIDLWAADTRTAAHIYPGHETEAPELVFFTTLRYMGCNLDLAPEKITALQNALLKQQQIQADFLPDL